MMSDLEMLNLEENSLQGNIPVVSHAPPHGSDMA